MDEEQQHQMERKVGALPSVLRSRVEEGEGGGGGRQMSLILPRVRTTAAPPPPPRGAWSLKRVWGGGGGEGGNREEGEVGEEKKAKEMVRAVTEHVMMGKLKGELVLEVVDLMRQVYV